MDTLSELLKPYATIVSTAATAVTMCQFVAPAVICKEIYDAKSTKGKPSTQFVMGICVGLMMTIYANLVNDPVMIRSNYIGLTLNFVYAYCFYYFLENKSEFWKPLSKGLVLLGVVYIYTKLENPEYVEQRLGICLTITMFSFIASPLFGIKEIMRKRNAEILPMPMVWCGTAMSFLWLLHGIITKNVIMIVQNVVGLGLSAVQIFVWVMFRGGVPEEKPKKVD